MVAGATHRGLIARPELVVDRVLVGLAVLVGLYVTGLLFSAYAARPAHLFSDADLYYEATAAWLAGSDPWAVRVDGVAFAGIPPTLLANLPLQLFGEGIARPFWALAGMASWVFAIWRYHLPLWWFVFPPFWEGWLAGSPDPVLFAAIAAGGGALAAAIKPYSVPAMLAERRLRAVLIGAVLVVATVPLLPWGLFLSQAHVVRDTLEQQAVATSAWGEWPMFAAAAIALVSLGWRLGLALAVPALAPAAQLHYNLFSVPSARRSPALAIILSVPHLAAPGIVVYALLSRLRPLSYGEPSNPVAEGRDDS